MAPTHRYLPGFRTICTVVSIAYVVLGGSMVVRGPRAAMEQFGVPEVVLSSAHFADFFHWVFVHMMVLGVMIGLLGQYVREGKPQAIVARVLLLLELHYTYLDLRTSDSAFGNRLYRGSASLIPVMIDVLVTLSFLYLSVRPLRESPSINSPEAPV